MQPTEFPIELKCPYCSKGKIMASNAASTSVSSQCPNCRNFFVGDLETKRVRKTRASPNSPRKPNKRDNKSNK